MVTIVKHEWHSVDSQFAFELERELLEEIYPDMDEDELDELWAQVESGEADLDEILDEADNNGVDIDWDRQYDDWYSDRKGGYDITYEYGDESSWVEQPKEPEPSHKCSNCKWQGRSYHAEKQYLRADGTVIEDYWNTDEECSSVKDVCPMCSGDLLLTEVGIQEEKEHAEWEKKWEEENGNEDSE